MTNNAGARAGEGAKTTCRGNTAVISFMPRSDGTISNRGAAALLDEVETALADERIYAIVLKGDMPGIFIRHANLEQIARAGQALQRGEIELESFLTTPFQRLCAAIDKADKPVIAAINGSCMGGGLEIALACTVRVAQSDVQTIGLPEIRIGIPPGCGGPQRLARVIGPHRARLFTLEGRIVDALQASELGLVDYLAEDAVGFARDWARRLAFRSRPAVRAVLRQCRVDDEIAVSGNALHFAEVLRCKAATDEIKSALRADGGLETRV